jgi:hypothetical protein
MALKFTNIFHSKTLKNLPKFGFWFENTYTIWQPCLKESLAFSLKNGKPKKVMAGARLYP